MNRLRSFGRFWWDFVVGDDVPLALGVLATVGLTALLLAAGVDAWWLPAPAVMGLLAVRIAYEARARRR